LAHLRQDVIAAITRVIVLARSCWGPQVEMLEAKLAAPLGVSRRSRRRCGRRAVLAFIAVGVTPGDEVITRIAYRRRDGRGDPDDGACASLN